MKDNWNVYFSNEKVADALAHSFQDLGFGYGKDAWHVFYFGEKIPDAMPSSFQILRPYAGYARDSWYVYYFGKKIPYAKPSSFQIIQPYVGYTKDIWNVYYFGEKVPDTTPHTFQSLGNGYGKDSWAHAYDTEQERMIDRIKCIAFRAARDAGATFINRQWIADKIHRTTRFVTAWWEKSYDRCFTDYSNAGCKLKLSQTSQDIIHKASGRQRNSCSIVAKEIAKEQKKYVTGRTINNYRHREGLKPFHIIPKPLKSETHISNRLWLCDCLEDWTEEGFLQLSLSDEFYVWLVRTPIYQNDRIWILSAEDIEEDERYREMVQNQICIGIFIIFTYKRLLWVIKDKRES
ncbi:unnamed protein product [Rotaria sp. Silwood1]|nr:unnamed protein product [Rotaria sp. Silwood1]CAF1265550.1 unnamed protein product [Rotaria sp. Silwood1]CAF3480663.1 unnamed protein product [Rotaria sp. Silwood1]CAF4631238.1 unnamed protein product [Rotaria sp. Silwood1]CAF4955071.1 unnamed protein product [Rotaria sp. Silwood1]